jgi:hypothetical protein
MRDAADALDYLHELYKLQHLDIKPANLLIVGGRVKVADFGLLKDLGDEVEHSIVGGLTPIYAPPELFDGRPSIHTDQYSLAVMYQELLTGTRPFSGRTIAQLATQHIHNAPNLKPLPPSDRPVIARALEKSPDRRFRSCSEFVDALSHQQRLTSGPGGDDDRFSSLQPIQQSEVQDLPELQSADENATNSTAGQALVVALGGTGADCIAKLRRRVHDLRSLAPLVLHSVLIDVDTHSSIKFDDDFYSDHLPYCACIKTPLRAAIEYRNRGTEHLKSISRRWMYNIPKSASTEGMRPLGRLALIDHAENVTKGLRTAIAQLRESARGNVPNIYLVGSLAGGTGSGMFVDIAHLLRFLLDEAGLHDTEILSLLSTARMQGDASRPLVLHDTKAALQEIKHFLRPGNSYPGDQGANWQSVPAARTPLHNTYLIAASQAPRSPSPADTIVDYLWIDATNAGRLLDSARQYNHTQQDTNSATPALRSVGIVQLSGTRRLEENVLAPATTRHLLRRWLGDPNHAEKFARPLVQRVSRRCNLSTDGLFDQVLQAFAAEPNARRLQLANFLKGLPRKLRKDAELTHQQLGDFINSTLTNELTDIDLEHVMHSLEREMATRLIDRRLDVASAIESVKMFSAQLHATATELQSQADAPIDPAEFSSGDLNSRIGFAECVLAGICARLAAHQAQRIQEHLSLYEQTLSVRAMTLAKAIRAVSGDKQGAANAWDQMTTTLRDQFETVIDELHGVCAPGWLVKLLSAGGNAVKPEQLVNEIMEAAVPLVCRAVVTSDKAATDSQFAVGDALEAATAIDNAATSRVLSSENAESIGVTASLTDLASDYHTAANEAPVLTIEEAVAAVRPALLACGGYQRLILIVGSKAEQEVLEPQVQQYHQGKLTTVIIDSAAPMLVHEAERIVIDDVVDRLTALSGGDDQISRRLLSRCDVDWMIH